MRRLPHRLLTVAILLTAAPACLRTDWHQIPKPALRAFEPQQPRRVSLPNGMVIYLQEDRELPLVSGLAMVRGGGRDEPAGKSGLASIYGEVWRTGGTKTRTGDALDDFLEARGAKVETFADDALTSITMSCLKADFDDVFGAFVELLRAPELREEKIDLAKRQLYTAIARRNDSAGTIAAREAVKLAYGPRSPLARVPEYATVAAVTREDLLAWHRAHVHPNQILLGFVGDFDAAALEAKLRAAFESWPRGPAAPKTEIAIEEPKPGVYVVQKDDVSQSEIRLVHLGITRDNPDYFAVRVMNAVLSGGFSARLFSNLRTKKGLAYRVRGTLGAGFDHPGMLQLSIGTRTESTTAAITGLLEEVDDIVRRPPSAAELALAKEVFMNSFVFRLDSKAKVLRERLTYEFYGFPSDFLERLRAGVEKVTAEDVTRVARKYLHKDKLRILVVGKTASFLEPLKAFGPVSPIDVTIPPPAAGAAR